MYYIGVDIGGTNISAGAVIDEYKIVLKKSFKTGDCNYTDVRDGIVKAVNDIITDLKKMFGTGKEDIQWVGIGCPGTCNIKTGIVETSNNLGWNNAPLEIEIEKALGIQTFVDNDANSAAYGEFLAGAAKGANSAVIITLGTGVGSGIIINKQLFYGENYAGGEIGHTVIEVDGPQCTCGRRGCFEVFSSAAALKRMTREAIIKHPHSKIKQIAEEYGKISARTAFEAQRAGDVTADRIVKKYIKYLSVGIANTINIFQPDVLCIGGGVCNEGNGILTPLREETAKNIFSVNSKKQTRIVICSLGNDAGIIGASMLGKLRLKIN